MGNIMLNSSMVTDVTTVSNFFIDEYMPKANGDFVKVYIHLLRLLNGQNSNLNLSKIADNFNFTEGDIMRALKYWEELGLLSISRDKNNTVNGIRLEPFGKDKHFIKGVSMHMESFDNVEKKPIPHKKMYSAGEIECFARNQQVGQLMFLAQAYLSKPLSSTDINCLLYMYDCLALSTDFIEYIMENCINEGYKSLSYIEKTALSFYERGITDIDSAKKYKKNNLNLNKKILKAFGITGRLAGKDEMNFIVKWQNEFGLNEEIIIEACNRTISHIHKPSFVYADSILSTWYHAGVRKISDIAALDEKHTKETAGKYAAKKAAGVNSPKLKGGQNIKSHSYNFEELEKQLLASEN